jgi:hypothetical protein
VQGGNPEAAGQTPNTPNAEHRHRTQSHAVALPHSFDIRHSGFVIAVPLNEPPKTILALNTISALNYSAPALLFNRGGPHS